MNRRIRLRVTRPTTLVLALALAFAGNFATVASAASRRDRPARVVHQIEGPQTVQIGDELALGFRSLAESLEAGLLRTDEASGTSGTSALITTSPGVPDDRGSRGVLLTRYTGVPCPDRQGIVRGTLSVTFDETVGTNQGASQQVEVDVEIRADGNANLAGYTLRGTFADGAHDATGRLQTARSTFSSRDSSDPRVTVTNNGGRSRRGALETATGVSNAAQNAAAAAAENAQRVWRDGSSCVTINVASGDGGKVKPLERVTIRAKGVAKDGAAIRTPVKGELVEGTSSLNGGDGNSPTTSFKYKGPKPKQKGKVALTSTSNRGIGKKTLIFTTAADYKLKAEDLGLFFTATKCGGIAGTWTVSIDAPDAFNHDKIDLTKRSTSSFEVPTEPEPGMPVTVQSALFPSPRSQSFIFTFFAVGSEVGASTDGPQVGIDADYGGSYSSLKEGDFCSEGN